MDYYMSSLSELIPICINNLDYSLLHDPTTEAELQSFGYHNIDYKYMSNENYLNDKNIEKNIHLIWIGSQINNKYFNTVIKCQTINTDYKIHLWIDDSTLNNDHKSILDSYNIIYKNIYTELTTNSNELKAKILTLLSRHPNYGYKADIIRLFVVYLYGGIYSDIDSVWLKPFDNNFIKEFVCYRSDIECKDIGNGLFGFCKDSVILYNILNNLEVTIDCISRSNSLDIMKRYIPVMTGGQLVVRVLRETQPSNLNYIHQAYCVIGGPHEKLFSEFSKSGKSYCYQTFDKNWC